MNYATTYHFGNDTVARRTETKSPAQAVERICLLDGTTEGRKRDTKGQTSTRTDSPVTNAFLRTSFLPKVRQVETIQDNTVIAKLERDFYESLSMMAKHYGVEPMVTSLYAYPYNISLAMWDIEQRLENKVADFDFVELVEKNNKTCFVVGERYNTGRMLYYIPIVPLYWMLRDKRRKRSAGLLLSVCSYLFHCADIAYYRQDSVYLYSVYDMLKDWTLMDDDGEDRTLFLSELFEAEYIGDVMERKLYNLGNIERFSERLKHLERFEHRDDLDNNCLKLAREALELSMQYPNQTIYRNAVPRNMEEEEDGYPDEYPISVEMYVSFCANARGELFDQLFDSVNTELNEYSDMVEPAVAKHFDGNEIMGSDLDLDFERRLFALIDELIYLLDNYKNVSHE